MSIMTMDYAKSQVKTLEQTCLLRPTALHLADLAACYFTLGDPEKALVLSLKAWELNKNPGICLNIAMILKDLGRHEESLKFVEQAYFSNPDDFYSRLGYGEALLKAGFWKQAWPIYDNARPTQQAAMQDLGLPGTVKEWDGSPLPEGHQLLVINEGGTGDRISYPRWLPELTKLNINWIFYPYSELFSFFERLLPRKKLIKDGDVINATHWTTTFALPAKLNIGPNEIPKPLPITADSEVVKNYAFGRNEYPAIGICYSAAEMFQGDRKVRSLTEGQAMRIVSMTCDKIRWVNLQYGTKMPYPVTNVNLNNWEDTAALISQLDGVVTVDTGVMHMAGSLNRPVATLLSGNSCWKFGKTGKKCKWYPTSRLYRNKGVGFENAIDELILALREGTAFNT